MNLEVSDATVDGWELVLHQAYDDDLLGATVDVLKTWEKTFMPPPGVILKASGLRTHRRMKELDD